MRETLEEMAEILIDQQYGDPVYAAAIDHEERRLPASARSLETDLRFGALTTALITRHRAEISRSLPEAAPEDLLAIARAMVEAGSWSGQKPPDSLKGRIVRALMGYLVLE